MYPATYRQPEAIKLQCNAILGIALYPDHQIKTGKFQDQDYSRAPGLHEKNSKRTLL